MLIPFLDILCSLIGVLVLIIVVLCVAQTQRAKGRSAEDIQRSQKYVEVMKQQQQQQSVSADLKPQVAKLEELRKTEQEKSQQLAKLRKLLDSSAEIRQMNQELSEKLLKELDNLLVEIDGLKRHENDIKKEVASLMAELKKRNTPPDKTTPPVIVQPGGSGMAEGAKVFFVEASGGRLTIFWDGQRKTVLSAADDVIATDPPFQYFLKTVAGMPNSKILFLLRDDGMGAFNKAAGWAQATYGYGVDQIGRLPIPGRGEIDLKMFQKFLGSLEPPPDAKVVAPPAASKT